MGFMHQRDAEGKGHTNKCGIIGERDEVPATTPMAEMKSLGLGKPRAYSAANPLRIPFYSGQHQSLLMSQMRQSNGTTYTSAARQYAQCCQGKAAYSPGVAAWNASPRLCDMQDCREPRLKDAIVSQ
jgi:hypothetical protein